jgi:hypothetical protein
VEQKRLLTHTLKLERERGNDFGVARALGSLSDANRLLGLYEEGIQQAKEALEIYERLGDTVEQARCLIHLARCCVSRQSARRRGGSRISRNRSSPGERPRISGLPISSRSWQYISFQGREREGHSPFRGSPRNRIPFQLARSAVLDSSLPGGALFRSKASSTMHTLTSNKPSRTRLITHTTWVARSLLQARDWYRQRMLEEATSEALRALEIFEKLGAAEDLEGVQSSTPGD